MYYHGDNNVYYLLGPKDSPIIAACHEKGFNIPVPEDGVYIGRFRVDGIVGCNRLARFLEGQKELFYIYNPTKDGIKIREYIQCKVLVVSSPLHGAENYLKNMTIEFYMPLWSLAELEEGNKKREHVLPKDKLLERWNKYGGVARWVLADGDDKIGEGMLQQAVNWMNDNTIGHLLDPFNNNTYVSKDHSGLVVHMIPTEDLCSYKTRISTPSMFDEIRTKRKLSTNQEVML